MKAFMRDFKWVFSSKLEALILQLTRPDDKPVRLNSIDELISELEEAQMEKEYLLAALSKLSRKLYERDVRTKLKALYVLHMMSQRLKGEAAAIFCGAFGFLCEATDSRTHQLHFDVKKALAPAKTRADLLQLLKSTQIYAKYVKLRATIPELCISAPAASSSDLSETRKLLASAAATLQSSQASLHHPLFDPCVTALSEDLRIIQKQLVAMSKEEEYAEALQLLQKYENFIAKKVTPKADTF